MATQTGHRAFREGVRALEGGQPVLSGTVTTNPATSERQRRFMGAAYRRAKEGHPRRGDPHMSQKQLREFASK